MKFGRPDWAALPLRLVMGSVLIVSGYGKLSHISNTVAFFAKYGFPIPVATAWFIGLLELFGGAALILGLFVRFLGLIYAHRVHRRVGLGTAAQVRFFPKPVSLHVDRQWFGLIRTWRGTDLCRFALK